MRLSRRAAAGGPPQVPVNYMRDFAGGSMFLAAQELLDGHVGLGPANANPSSRPPGRAAAPDQRPRWVIPAGTKGYHHYPFGKMYGQQPRMTVTQPAC